MAAERERSAGPVDGVVVKTGTYLWAGAVECDVRIVRRDVLYGPADHEDPPEVADDQAGEWYYVEYGSTTQRGVFNAGAGAVSTLVEAVRRAERAPGIGPTITWRD